MFVGQLSEECIRTNCFFYVGFGGRSCFEMFATVLYGLDRGFNANGEELEGERLK